MRVLGNRFTGTITIEVDVDEVTMDDDAYNVATAALLKVTGGDLPLALKLNEMVVHDDLSWEPYEMDGPEYD